MSLWTWEAAVDLVSSKWRRPDASEAFMLGLEEALKSSKKTYRSQTVADLRSMSCPEAMVRRLSQMTMSSSKRLLGLVS